MLSRPLVDPSERMNARLRTLHSLSRALARPLDLVAILRSLYAEMTHVLDVPICFFGLYDAPGQSVDVIWQIHEGAELPGGHFPLGAGPTSDAIRTCQAQLIRHWSKQGPRVQVQYATQRPDLPESSITVPVLFDDRVLGVLSVQSYEPEAFDEDDLALVQGIVDQAAVAITAARQAADAPREAGAGNPDLEAILASMADALLVLDHQGHLVRLNQAARNLLCPDEGTLILGYPVDRPQDGRWPLGTQALTEQLQPVIDQLKRGAAPAEEFKLSLQGEAARPVSCKASVLFKEGAPAGGVMVLREISAQHAA
jgi:PAS domain-containing protein